VRALAPQKRYHKESGGTQSTTGADDKRKVKIRKRERPWADRHDPQTYLSGTTKNGKKKTEKKGKGGEKEDSRWGVKWAVGKGFGEGRKTRPSSIWVSARMKERGEEIGRQEKIFPAALVLPSLGSWKDILGEERKNHFQLGQERITLQACRLYFSSRIARTIGVRIPVEETQKNTPTVRLALGRLRMRKKFWGGCIRGKLVVRLKMKGKPRRGPYSPLGATARMGKRKKRKIDARQS